MSVTLAANDDGAIVEPQAPSNLIAFLARAVHDPSVDVHKLEAIYRIITDERREQREMRAAELRVEFHDEMSAVEAEMKAVVRNALNTETRSKHATLEAVDDAIRPLYTKRGFSLSFSQADNDAAEIKIICVVRRKGHEETFFLCALSDMTGPKGGQNKTNVQGVGSTVSYLRRYLTCMIFNVALRDDNDGNRQRPANDTGEVLGREAIDLLANLIAETKTDERKLLVHMGFPDLITIKDVPAREFARFKTALLTKKSVLSQRAVLAAKSQTQQGAVA